MQTKRKTQGGLSSYPAGRNNIIEFRGSGLGFRGSGPGVQCADHGIGVQEGHVVDEAGRGQPRVATEVASRVRLFAPAFARGVTRAG